MKDFETILEHPVAGSECGSISLIKKNGYKYLFLDDWDCWYISEPITDDQENVFTEFCKIKMFEIKDGIRKAV